MTIYERLGEQAVRKVARRSMPWYLRIFRRFGTSYAEDYLVARCREASTIGELGTHYRAYMTENNAWRRPRFRKVRRILQREYNIR